MLVDSVDLLSDLPTARYVHDDDLRVLARPENAAEDRGFLDLGITCRMSESVQWNEPV